jgi:hypothetical protein
MLKKAFEKSKCEYVAFRRLTDPLAAAGTQKQLFVAREISEQIGGAK